jgi:hypothetical protein
MVTIVGAAAVPVVAVGRAWARRRALKRNAAALCGACGRVWQPNPDQVTDAFLVEGQLFCSDCASKLRRRTIASATVFVALAGGMFLFTWGPIVDVIGRFGLIDGLAGLSALGWAYFLPPLILLGGADWSIRRMRSKNVVALEALARARLLSGPPESDPATAAVEKAP